MDHKERRDFKRPYKGRARGNGGKDSGPGERDRRARPRSDDRHERGRERPVTENPVQRQRPISNDPQRLLFRGVDLQSKGEINDAMVMFIHGSVLMSKGCENNALRILEGMDSSSFKELRDAIAGSCSDDALIEFDYLCRLKDSGYVCKYLEDRYSEGVCQAVYRKICLNEVEAEDTVIDAFSKIYGDPRVAEGLRILAKRKGSKKAEDGLAALKKRDEDRQYVHTAFARAMKGDRKSVKDLERLSSEFTEAEFFIGYIRAREKGNGIQWLRDNYSRYGTIMISEEFNLRVGETPFGMYLRAKKIQSKKEDWIPSMIKAARYGSEEAMEELRPLMKRTDIRKAIAGIHLSNNDLPGLIDDYVKGLDDTQFLDKYCENVPTRIVDVGKGIGERDVMRHIDWLRAHAFMMECREALVTLVKDDRYHSRKLIFALHDVGKNIEAADLFFSMEGDPELPAVKWLQKVCRDEDAKEHVRSHYESIGDLKTFDYIFEDDGYRRKPSFKGKRKGRF